MDNPFASVIIPNYNHAKYLDQRIQSVLNQTYQNFEVIILDDCSPDNGASRAVIEKYRDNPHVSHIVYNEVNSGSTFKQWHKGFELAKGEWIWIAESDDYCEATFLEKCIERQSFFNNVSIVFSTSQLVDTLCNNLSLQDISETIQDGIFNGVDFIRRYMTNRNSIWNASAVLLSRKKALEIEKDYMSYVAAGDHMFWIELAELGDVIHISDKLNYFRQHVQKVTPSKYKQGITHLEELRTFKYICRKKHINYKQKYNTMLHYIREIKMFSYMNPDIKSQILQEWRKFDLFLYLLCLVRIGMLNNRN